MSDVIFITPNFDGYVHDEPLGTLLLATILRKNGVQVDILQFHNFGSADSFSCFIDNAIECIFARNPRIVSFYTRCDSYHISIKIAQEIRLKSRDIYIVFAGPQADLVSKETLLAIPEIDYICCGEGENTIVPFFTSLISGKPDHTVDGLVYRRYNEIVLNPRPTLMSDLDLLPDIDYTLLNSRSEDYLDMARKYFPVDVGRGCPFACTFCSTKTFWGRTYRLKSADKIISEIKQIHNEFGATRFNFEHDMFTMNRDNVIRICKMIKGIGFPITWRCSARLDCLDEALIDTMADAGMDKIFIGIETGSTRMQGLINKNLKLEHVEDKLNYLSEKGIDVVASFIFGFPEETEEDFCQTMKLMLEISRIKGITLQHHLCTFLAGTELTARYIDHIRQAAVLSDITGGTAVSECKTLIEAHPALFPHFFEHPDELRDKVKYYPYFFRCWVAMRPVYEYIASHYYQDQLCDMLFDFSERNKKLMNDGVTWIELLKQDAFIDSFSDDNNYQLLKEICRFLSWKADPDALGTELFGFDVKALLNGVQIMDIRRSPTIAIHTKNAEGNCVLKLICTKN